LAERKWVMGYAQGCALAFNSIYWMWITMKWDVQRKARSNPNSGSEVMNPVENVTTVKLLLPTRRAGPHSIKLPLMENPLIYWSGRKSRDARICLMLSIASSWNEDNLFPRSRTSRSCETEWLQVVGVANFSPDDPYFELISAGIENLAISHSMKPGIIYLRFG